MNLFKATAIYLLALMIEKSFESYLLFPSGIVSHRKEKKVQVFPPRAKLPNIQIAI